jgi:SAM-dependent methyltransferase
MKSTSKQYLNKLKKLYWRLLSKANLLNKKPKEVFNDIFQQNSWGDKESVSGPGSRLNRTDKIRQSLPQLLKKYDIHSILDIPCGDFNWMKLLELNIDYTGGDIVKELIYITQQKYSNDLRRFLILDLINDPLPEVDIILCRDCLVHFSHSDIIRALMNFKSSKSKYLLVTTFPQRTKNKNIITGEWRPINLNLPPFSFPLPLELLDDSYDSANYYDKSLGLWNISELPLYY